MANFISSAKSIVPYCIANPPPSDSVLVKSGPLKQAHAIIENFLSMRREEIYSQGIDPKVITSWILCFKESGQFLSLSNLDEYWVQDPQFKFGGTAVNSNTLSDYFSVFCSKEFWAIPETKKGQFEEKLAQLYQHHRSITGSHDLVYKQVIFKFMDLLGQRIAEANGYPNKPYFTFPLPDGKNSPMLSHRHLICFQALFGWHKEPAWHVGFCDRYPTNQLHAFIINENRNGAQILLLDVQDRLISDPCVFMNSYHPSKAELLATFEHKCIVEGKNPKLGLDPVQLAQNKRIECFIWFYKGATIPFDFQINALTFFSGISAINQRRTPVQNMYPTKEGEIRHLEYLTKCEEIVGAYQNQIIDLLKKNPETRVQFELMEPQSRSDQLLAGSLLLKELACDPAANAIELFILAEKMKCSFPKEEADALIKAKKARTIQGDVLEVTPEGIAEALQKHIGREFKNCSAKPQEGLPLSQSQIPILTGPSLSSSSSSSSASSSSTSSPAPPPVAAASSSAAKAPQPAAPLPPSATKKKDDLEEQVRRERKRHEIADHKGADKSLDPQFQLSPKDQAVVDRIRSGFPLKAKQFTIFAMSLLRKKAQAVKAALPQKTKGSHPKLRFKPQRGPSGGVTFRIHHGGDQHGLVSQQKDTLDRIFTL